MAIAIRTEAIKDDLNDDYEYLSSSFLLRARILLCIGNDKYTISIVDGTVVSFEPIGQQIEESTVSIRGSEQGWSLLLQDPPPPYYQDLLGLRSRHGFEIGGDVETLFAYYKSLNRILEVMRINFNSGGN